MIEADEEELGIPTVKLPFFAIGAQSRGIPIVSRPVVVAAVLIEEIDRGQRRGLAAGELMVLRRYERRRRGPNTLMMQSMTGFKELFAADQLPVRWLRNSGLDVSNRIAPLKSQFMLHAMGLKGDIPRLARASTL